MGLNGDGAESRRCGANSSHAGRQIKVGMSTPGVSVGTCRFGFFRPGRGWSRAMPRPCQEWLEICRKSLAQFCDLLVEVGEGGFEGFAVVGVGGGKEIIGDTDARQL